MKGRFKLFFADNLLFVSSTSSFLVLILTFLLVVIFYPHIPPLIPIFNSMPWGEQRLASSLVLFSFPILFAMVLCVNNLLAFFLYSRYTLASRMLAMSSALFVCLGFFAFLQILFLVF